MEFVIVYKLRYCRWHEYNSPFDNLEEAIKRALGMLEDGVVNVEIYKLENGDISTVWES